MATRRRRIRRRQADVAGHTAIGYIRVSTVEQASVGLSLDAQRSRLAAWAELHGVALVDVIEDAGLSASSLDRPGLTRALAMVGSGAAGTLVVTKLDRLTRNVRDLGVLVAEHFGEHGADLVSVAESIDTRSAAGRLVLNVLGSVAQWEREAIGERTRDALASKRRRRERTGAVRYGYRLAADGVHLEPDEREQSAIREAVRLCASGMSLRAVASELARLGHHARSGRPFAAMQIARMVDAADVEVAA